MPSPIIYTITHLLNVIIVPTNYVPCTYYECVIHSLYVCADEKRMYSAMFFRDPSPPEFSSVAIFTVTQLQATYIKVDKINE